METTTIANERWELFLESNKAVGNWKNIPEYDHKSFWWVSDHGRIKVTNNYNDLVHWPRIYLTGGHTRKRYAALSINYAPSKYIHRLVAMAFIPNPHDYRTVNHLDGNPLNNHVDNLAWASHRENILHGFDMRRSGSMDLANNEYDQIRVVLDAYDSKMEKYLLVRDLRAEGHTYHKIAELTGVPSGTVSSICRWWKRNSRV